jgi:hypothetical protein
MTLGEGLLGVIVVLLLIACGLLGYGVYILQESIQTQRRLVRLWLTSHRPIDALPQEERQERV